jgi:hypothetical protein
VTKDINDISEVEFTKRHAEHIGPSVTHRQDRSLPTGWFIDSQYVSESPACFHEVLKRLTK